MPRSGVENFVVSAKTCLCHLETSIDAFRESVVSALSFFVFPLDVALKRDPQNDTFLKVLDLGWRSERLVNLFGQHNREVQKVASAEYSKTESKP